jgi:hypothetical protein
MMKSSNTFVMRKQSDKTTKSAFNGQTVVTTSKHFKAGSNGKSSFFGARRSTLTSTESSGYHPHHHGEFHRKNAISTSTHHQKKWQKKESRDESAIDSGSCTNTTPSVNKKLKSVESNCASSQTSGHASKTTSQDSFGVKDLKQEIKVIEMKEAKNAAEKSVESLESLQQIQEAKPGNKRALLVDLPAYLYSIPALASFFEPYGEVAMLQILPTKKMWDEDLVDLLGASMCNKLSNQSLCAVVEFYSARMAKFIIGILRKRLPILKFRCALLKPSAAIELTNQAENLGLNGVVVMNNKPAPKATISSDSCNEHSEEDQKRHSSESGCDEVSNHQRLPSYGFSDSESDESAESAPVEQPAQPENKRFVTSFQINLGR